MYGFFIFKSFVLSLCITMFVWARVLTPEQMRDDYARLVPTPDAYIHEFYQLANAYAHSIGKAPRDLKSQDYRDTLAEMFLNGHGWWGGFNETKVANNEERLCAYGALLSLSSIIDQATVEAFESNAKAHDGQLLKAHYAEVNRVIKLGYQTAYSRDGKIPEGIEPILSSLGFENAKAWQEKVSFQRKVFGYQFHTQFGRETPLSGTEDAVLKAQATELLAMCNPGEQAKLIAVLEEVKPEDRPNLIMAVHDFFEGVIVPEGNGVIYVLNGLKEHYKQSMRGSKRYDFNAELLPLKTLVRRIPSSWGRARIYAGIHMYPMYYEGAYSTENMAKFIDSVHQLCDGIDEFDEGPFETFFLGDDHYNIMWLLKSVPAPEQEAFVKYLMPWFEHITSGSERTALVNILLHTPSSQRETFSQEVATLFKGAEPYGNFFYGTALLWGQIPLEERVGVMAILGPLLPQLPTIFSRYHVLTALKNKTTVEREAFATSLQNLVEGLAHLDGIAQYEYPTFCNAVDLFLGLPADQHAVLLKEMEPLAAIIKSWDVREVTQYFIKQPYEQWHAFSEQSMCVLEGAYQGSAVDVLKALKAL
jgi:hypothetical protein